jgi:hypothetical protein
MSEQLFFVSRGRTIRGPVTNRKKYVKDGRTTFSGESGRVYRSHDGNGNPIALPSGFVNYAKGKKESNGQCLLQNLIEDGSIVFEAGGSTPISFAPAMKVDLLADPKGGGLTEEPKGK